MMDAPVSSPPVLRIGGLTMKTWDRLLTIGIVVVAILIIVLICAASLGVHALAIHLGGGSQDAWVTWWGAIWPPIVWIVTGIIVDIALFVVFIGSAYDD